MKVSASIVPDSCRLFLWGGGCFFVSGAVCGFPFAIQVILQKRVCRCIVLLFFLYPAVAIQVFPLEMVCRCTESQKERRFLSAIQVILRKRVCRCTEPLHGTSARNLCTEPLHRTAARAERKVAFCCRRGLFGIVFEKCSLDELDERTYEDRAGE